MFDSLPGMSQLVSAIFCVSFSGRVNVIESICEPVPRDWSGKDRQVFDMPKVTGWAGYSVNLCSRLILLRLGHRTPRSREMFQRRQIPRACLNVADHLA